MSRTLAVIPLRGSLVSKTRLTPIFRTQQRQRLVWAMLDHVVSATQASGVVDEIVIVTRDAEAVANHVEVDDTIRILAQPSDLEGLNGALEFGRTWAGEQGFDALLLVPGDLPMISATDVQAIVSHAEDVVIAPDCHGDGTNAMLLRLAAVRAAEETAGERFRFMMGMWSSSNHRAAAEQIGLSCAVLALSGLELDLDTPDDWERLPEPLRGRYLAIAEDAMVTTAGHQSMRDT